MSAQGGPRAAEWSDTATDATTDPSASLRPAEAFVDTGVIESPPVGPASPFYVREWRGGPLYFCPAGDVCFSGRSHRAIIKHILAVHQEPTPPEPPSIEKRAQAAGIILATR